MLENRERERFLTCTKAGFMILLASILLLRVNRWGAIKSIVVIIVVIFYTPYGQTRKATIVAYVTFFLLSVQIILPDLQMQFWLQIWIPHLKIRRGVMSPLVSQFWKQQPARAKNAAGKKFAKWLIKKWNIFRTTYPIAKRFARID
jgi:hypothetical protein